MCLNLQSPSVSCLTELMYPLLFVPDYIFLPLYSYFEVALYLSFEVLTVNVVRQMGQIDSFEYSSLFEVFAMKYVVHMLGAFFISYSTL